MTKLEIACVIIGLIMMCADWTDYSGNSSKTCVIVLLLNIFRKLMYLTMILLPFYFNIWSKL